MAKRGAVWLGTARSGAARNIVACHGGVQQRAVVSGKVRLGGARLGAARSGATRRSEARHGWALRGPARNLGAGHNKAWHGIVWQCMARRGKARNRFFAALRMTGGVSPFDRLRANGCPFTLILPLFAGAIVALWVQGERGAFHPHPKPSPINGEGIFLAALRAALDSRFRGNDERNLSCR